MTYHTDTTRISKSGLDLINRAPALYYERYLNPTAEPQKETPALIIGSAVHCAVLSQRNLANVMLLPHDLTNEPKRKRQILRRLLQMQASAL
jgi:hypothetical protein